MRRKKLIDLLVSKISGLDTDGPAFVAIDGPGTAGKTSLRKELAERLDCAEASIDDFLYPKRYRYHRGSWSPVGYYLDAFNYTLFDRFIRGVRGSEESLLLVDGVFLQRPELNHYWDFRIFVDVGLSTMIRRGLKRDSHLEFVACKYAFRYIPAQIYYRHTCTPHLSADMWIDNRDVSSPKIVR